MSQYNDVDYLHPHTDRARRLLKAHPEVRQLFGNTPSSALWIVGVVALQIAMAALMTDAPWWAVLLAGYCIGAFADHSMYVMIHDCTHNLVFKGSPANKLIGMVANLPLVFPAAISFRHYHMLHHRYQGQMGWDADLASPWEARMIGASPLRKSLWMLLFFLVEGVIRPIRVGKVSLLERWTVFNILVQFSFNYAIWHFFGWGGFGYMLVSGVFSIGLHPVGIRWIQEHYLVEERAPGQETFSYYGPLNRVMFNIGFHNEHHDLMMVPWSNLPKLKAMAPEYYDTLYAHKSYLGLWKRFLFDRRMTLFSRIVRPDKPVSVAAVNAGIDGVSGAIVTA